MANNGDGFEAMMAAQGELSNINASRQQNLQSEQAFLQQQQATSDVMMQATQLGTDQALGEQVGGMNAQTQAILSQYGVNGVSNRPGKTTTTSKTTQSQGNTRIENKTITNNDIKIINQGGSGSNDGGNHAKFQTWLSNAFAKQQSDYDIQRRAFARRDRDLEKQSNKMMRNLEKSTQGLSEKLNPENYTKPIGSQFKTLLMLFAMEMLPKVIEPIGKVINNIEGTFRAVFGDGSDDPANEPGIVKSFKRLLGFSDADYKKNLSIWGKLGEIIGAGIKRIEDKMAEEAEDRRVAIAGIEKPKIGDGGLSPAAWLEYLGNVVMAGLGGTKAAANRQTTAIVKKGKDDITQEGSFVEKADNIKNGELYESDFGLGGNLKKDQSTVMRSVAAVGNMANGKAAENAHSILALMTEHKKIAKKDGRICLGDKAEADKYLEAWGFNIEKLQQAEKDEGKTYLIVEKEKIISWYEDGKEKNRKLRSLRVPKTDSRTSQQGLKDVEVDTYYLTAEGFTRIEQGLGFEFDSTDTSSYTNYITQKQKAYNEKNQKSNAEIKLGGNDMFDAQQELAAANTAHEQNISAIENRDDAYSKFTENVKDMIIDPLVDQAQSVINKAREAIVTSPFGNRIHPVLGKVIMHKGIDLKASEGTSIFSTGVGKVTFAGEKGAYGNLIEIEHPDGTKTRYAHLSQMFVKAGDEVTDGQHIGKAGKTGRVTGPHLHYEVIKGNKWIDPASNEAGDHNYSKALTPHDQDPDTVEPGRVEGGAAMKAEIVDGVPYYDEKFGYTMKIGDKQFSIDEAAYKRVQNEGGDILDAVNFSKTLQWTGDNTLKLAEMSDEEIYHAKKEIGRLLSSASYEGKGTLSDFLSTGTEKNMIPLGSFEIKKGVFTEAAYNQLPCQKDATDGRRDRIIVKNGELINRTNNLFSSTTYKYIEYYVMLTNDAKSYKSIAVNVDMNTGVLKTNGKYKGETWRTGKILYSHNQGRSWPEALYKDLGISEPTGWNPGFSHLGVYLIPEAKEVLDYLIDMLSNAHVDVGTGEVIIEGKKANKLQMKLLEGTGMLSGNALTDLANRQRGKDGYSAALASLEAGQEIGTYTPGIIDLPDKTVSTNPEEVSLLQQAWSNGQAIKDGVVSAASKVKSWWGGSAFAQGLARGRNGETEYDPNAQSQEQVAAPTVVDGSYTDQRVININNNYYGTTPGGADENLKS